MVVDAELARGLDVGGERGEVARDVGAALLLEPGLADVRVGHGLRRGEGLARRSGTACLRGCRPRSTARQFVAVDVGDEVEALARRDERVERQHRHLRPEVGAADADVDDVGDARCVARAPLSA